MENTKLLLQVIGTIAGGAYILTHQQDHWAILTVSGLMIISYLLFMATLPKNTNIISSWVSDIPPSKQ